MPESQNVTHVHPNGTRVTASRPAYARTDPYDEYIDRNSDDNLGEEE